MTRAEMPRARRRTRRWGLLAGGLVLLALASTAGGSDDVANPLSASAPLAAAGTAAPAPEGSRVADPVAPVATSRPLAAGPEVDALRRAVDGVLDGARWNRAEWSVLAVSLDRGDVLYDRSADLPLAPASNVKILTTAAALHYLGPDFRYPTYLLADGPIVDGVLQGNLVLYGTGDPALSDRFYRNDTQVFEELADQLTRGGIRAIAGDLVGDGTYFTGPATEATWNPDDVNEWFTAPVSALSFNENMVALRVEPADWVGAPPRIVTLPQGSGVPIDNQARTVGSPPEDYRRLTVVRETHTEPIRVVGEIVAGSTDVWREMTVSDPPLFAATLFKQTLDEAGVEIYGRVRSVPQAASSLLPARATWGPGFGTGSAPRVLAEHRSPPMSELLEVVNNESHNLFAEAVFRSVGATVVGEASFDGGATAAHRFLSEAIPGATEGLVLVDGSGLSPENRVSARLFVELMQNMERSPLAEAFRATLPEAGRRGELPRMHRSAASRNLRAKTGTIDGVSSLSGLVQSASGERIAFSIIANGVPSTWRAKRLEDRIGIELAEFSRP